MHHRLTAVSAFAVASLLATAAYAGSPYYDMNGQPTQPAMSSHMRTTSPTRMRSMVSPRAPAQYKNTSEADAPSMASDGFASTEADNDLFEHAAGNMGTPAGDGGATATATADPVYTAALPRMDADGFIHRQRRTSLYSHAVGTMGSPVVSNTTASPEVKRVYTAQAPQMDADGFAKRESDRSFYEHAVGTMGTP